MGDPGTLGGGGGGGGGHYAHYRRVSPSGGQARHSRSWSGDAADDQRRIPDPRVPHRPPSRSPTRTSSYDHTDSSRWGSGSSYSRAPPYARSRHGSRSPVLRAAELDPHSDRRGRSQRREDYSPHDRPDARDPYGGPRPPYRPWDDRGREPLDHSGPHPHPPPPPPSHPPPREDLIRRQLEQEIRGNQRPYPSSEYSKYPGDRDDQRSEPHNLLPPPLTPGEDASQHPKYDKEEETRGPAAPLASHSKGLPFKNMTWTPLNGAGAPHGSPQTSSHPTADATASAQDINGTALAAMWQEVSICISETATLTLKCETAKNELEIRQREFDESKRHHFAFEALAMQQASARDKAQQNFKEIDEKLREAMARNDRVVKEFFARVTARAPSDVGPVSAHLEAKLDDMTRELQHMKKITTQTQSLQHRLDTTEMELKRVQSDIEKVQAAAAMAKDLHPRLESVENRMGNLSGLKTDVDELREDLKRIALKTQETAEGTSKLDSEIHADDGLENTRNLLKEQQAALRKAEESLQRVEHKIDGALERLTALEALEASRAPALTTELSRPTEADSKEQAAAHATNQEVARIDQDVETLRTELRSRDIVIAQELELKLKSEISIRESLSEANTRLNVRVNELERQLERYSKSAAAAAAERKRSVSEVAAAAAAAASRTNGISQASPPRMPDAVSEALMELQRQNQELQRQNMTLVRHNQDLQRHALDLASLQQNVNFLLRLSQELDLRVNKTLTEVSEQKKALTVATGAATAAAAAAAAKPAAPTAVLPRDARLGFELEQIRREVDGIRSRTEQGAQGLKALEQKNDEISNLAKSTSAQLDSTKERVEQLSKNAKHQDDIMATVVKSAHKATSELSLQQGAVQSLANDMQRLRDDAKKVWDTLSFVQERVKSIWDTSAQEFGQLGLQMELLNERCGIVVAPRDGESKDDQTSQAPAAAVGTMAIVAQRAAAFIADSEDAGGDMDNDYEDDDDGYDDEHGDYQGARGHHGRSAGESSAQAVVPSTPGKRKRDHSSERRSGTLTVPVHNRPSLMSAPRPHNGNSGDSSDEYANTTATGQQQQQQGQQPHSRGGNGGNSGTGRKKIIRQVAQTKLAVSRHKRGSVAGSGSMRGSASGKTGQLKSGTASVARGKKQRRRRRPLPKFEELDTDEGDDDYVEADEGDNTDDDDEEEDEEDDQGEVEAQSDDDNDDDDDDDDISVKVVSHRKRLKR